MLTTENLDKALNIRSKTVKNALVALLFVAYSSTFYIGSEAVGPLLDTKAARYIIDAISTMDVLKPARDELSLTGIYIDSLLTASIPIFYTMGIFGFLVVLLTNSSVLSLFNTTSEGALNNDERDKLRALNNDERDKLRALNNDEQDKLRALNNDEQDKLRALNNDQTDRLKESIYTLLEFAKVKLGTGYFFPALLCVIYGGFTVGASVHLLFAQELKGLSSFIVAIVSMLILVALAILGFKHASIDLRKATLRSASLSFLIAIVIAGYSAYNDIQTKRNIMKLSEHIIELVKENQELNRELQRLKR